MNSPKINRFCSILGAAILGTGALVVGCGQPAEPEPAPVPSVDSTNMVHDATNAVPQTDGAAPNSPH